MGKRLLFVDHQDSFSHLLMDYLRQLQYELDWVQSEDLDGIQVQDYDAVVVSPGYGIPHEKSETIELIKSNIAHLPFLGICLGHQLLALVHDGTLMRCESPLHGKVTTLRWADSKLNTHDLPSIEIMHYHSWVVDNVPKDAEVLAYCNSTSAIMGIADKQMRYIGWQFHPESIGTQKGLEILDWSLKELLSANQS